jgi:hypothetical protein
VADASKEPRALPLASQDPSACLHLAHPLPLKASRTAKVQATSPFRLSRLRNRGRSSTSPPPQPFLVHVHMLHSHGLPQLPSDIGHYRNDDEEANKDGEARIHDEYELV